MGLLSDSLTLRFLNGFSQALNMFELGTSESIQKVKKYFKKLFGIRRSWGIPSNGLSLLVSKVGPKVLIFTNTNCEQRLCAISTGGIQNCKTSDWKLNFEDMDAARMW